MALMIILSSYGQGFKLFEPVRPGKSGIRFINTITEAMDYNALTHENMYNGGGVAVGDINNDGLDDIYFVSNMRFNKLYLNQGNLKFKDITSVAGVGGREGWKTGVTMVDINNDGLLDIYVCYCGKGPADNRRNQLFINKGNLKFEEKAKDYGLDDPTYSTLGAFFDYDLDGDLDMFLLATNVKVIRGLEFEQARVTSDPYAGDKLFRNDGERFVDVTEQACIISNGLGYGLGVAISDLNKDGWPDIYITNDYIEPDYLYINNKDGTFTNRLTEQILHISQSAMGNEINDFNNDGWPDIFTADMLPPDNRRIKLLYGPENYLEYALMVMEGFYHSSMRNMLQINNQNGTFSEIGQLAGVSNTDWSWAPPFADFDNDGWKDLFVTNGYFRDYTDRDFLKFKFDYYAQKGEARTQADTFYLVSFMKSTPVHNHIFRNNKDLTFTDKSIEWGFGKRVFSNGTAWSDLDLDGDLDLVVSNQNETALIFRNMIRESDQPANYLSIKLNGEGKNSRGLCSKVYVYAREGLQFQEQMPSRGYQSCVSTTLLFGLADAETADSVKVEWPGGKMSVLKDVKANQIIEISQSEACGKVISETPGPAIFNLIESPVQYEHIEFGTNDFSRQPLLTYMPSICGPVMASADVDGDNLEDIYVGGVKENPGKLFLQSPDGTFRISSGFVFAPDVFCTDSDALFFDADGDGDQDLYVVSGGYHDYGRGNKALQDRLYINNGKGQFTRTVDRFPETLISKSCVAAADIDGDGDLDLFVGGRLMPGNYPEPQQSLLLLNDGSGRFSDAAAEMIPDLASGGMITDAGWADLNNDNRPDLIIAGEFMPIRIFLNQEGKIFREATDAFFEKSEGGFWNKILMTDLDNDGDMDIVAGNFGTNSQIKGSEKEPVTMTFRDFDNNGSVDPILSYYIDRISYPFPSRNELLTQMNTMRRKFPDYSSYANAKLSDLFSAEELKSATVLTATELRTVLYINKGNKFEKRLLPIQAQFAPVHAIEILDYNNDGNKDMILAGNQNAMCVRLGVMDANYGQLYEGDGKGNFRYVPQTESGFIIVGDVRSLKTMTIRDTLHLFVGVNNYGVATYVLNQ
ncbi:MAG TPA: RNA-binding protein [Bacteroidales bacterium]|nr:RNA-binding protein [Bacteroidales bacterium]